MPTYLVRRWISTSDDRRHWTGESYLVECPSMFAVELTFPYVDSDRGNAGWKVTPTDNDVLFIEQAANVRRDYRAAREQEESHLRASLEAVRRHATDRAVQAAAVPPVEGA